ncbi:MAG TPA: hypothetical protein DIT99_03995 [Candidatus Latescibacteria bacterium]|nr:hypothetical protein [Candidatus Latescibacterota bacterium]
MNRLIGSRKPDFEYIQHRLCTVRSSELLYRVNILLDPLQKRGAVLPVLPKERVGCAGIEVIVPGNIDMFC